MEHTRQMFYECATGDGRTAEVAHRPTQYWALDSKTDALVRVSALIALGAPHGPCHRAISRALEAGASREDVVATLIAVAAIVGLARVVSAAPEVALGIGYGIDAALTR